MRFRVSEERRKRLLELEKQLDAYKKRLAEIKRLERENNNLQLKAKQLNHELMVRLLFFQLFFL